MKKILLFFIMLCLSLSFVACGETPPSPPKEVTCEEDPTQEKCLSKEEDCETNPNQDKCIYFDRMDIKDSSKITWLGRTYYNEDYSGITFSYSASGFEVKFEGTKYEAFLTPYIMGGNAYIAVYVDGVFSKDICISTMAGWFTLFEGEEGVHTIRVVKKTEYSQNWLSLVNTRATGKMMYVEGLKDLKIEVFGDSISCGYGAESETDSSSKSWAANKTYAYVTAQNLNADIQFVTYSGWGLYASPWGASNPDTSLNVPKLFPIITKDKTDAWDYSKFIPNIVIINLGTNDFWCSGANTSAFRKSYREAYEDFINKISVAYGSDVMIICCYGMMNATCGPDVEKVVQGIGDLYGIQNVYSLPLPLMTTSGYNGHPSVESHANAAVTLTNFIQEHLA